MVGEKLQMKVVFLGDAHWGARGNSEFFLQKQLQFYRDVFFPYLIENDIKHVVQMGDLLDQRKAINVNVLYHLRKEYLQRFEDLQIQHFVLVGNHDVVHNNTNKISALVEIANTAEFAYTNVIQYPYTLESRELKIDLIPWINNENKTEIMDFMRNSNSDILAGHLAINGFAMVSGLECKDGFETSLFRQYETVLSGHFHLQSKKGNIHYIGTPYQMSWSDYGDDKGFWVLDTETKIMEFIKNTDSIFHKINYDDESVDYDSFDELQYENCYVKVLVENKTNELMFDLFISRLQYVTYDLMISDTQTPDFSETDIEEMDIEDTLAILLKSVDSVDVSADKQSIKHKINNVYQETMDAMVAE